MPRLRTQGALSSPSSGYAWTVRITNPNPVSITVNGYVVSAGSERSIVFNPASQYGSAAYIREGKVSTMTDEPSGWDRYNPIDHSTEEWKCGLREADTFQYNGVKSGRPYSVLITGVCSARLAFSGFPGGSYPPYSSAAVLKSIASGQMKPGKFPVEHDLVQMLGELAEMRDTLNLIGVRLATLPQVVANYLTADPKLGRRSKYLYPRTLSLRGLAQLGINVDLARKLVWQPLISDCEKLKKAISKFDAVYRRAQNPEPIVVHGSASSESSFQREPGTVGNYITWHTSTRRRKVVTWALVKRSPVLPNQRAGFLRNYFGIWPRTSLAWEFTNLSFVVDYVVNVGDWLRAFEESPFEVPYKVLSSGHSVKDEEQRVGFVSVGPSADWTGLAIPSPVRGEATIKSYKRVVESLDFNVSSVIPPISVRVPSMTQVVTMTELLLSAFSGRVKIRQTPDDRGSQ